MREWEASCGGSTSVTLTEQECKTSSALPDGVIPKNTQPSTKRCANEKTE